MNTGRKIVTAGLAVTLMTAIVPSAHATESTTTPTAADSNNLQLVAGWDFTGLNGTTNTSIKDSTGTYDLTLYNDARIEQFGDRSNNEALQLKGDKGQYAEISSDVFANIGNNFTMDFSAKTRHKDDGNYFSFAIGKDSTHYLFTNLSTTAMKTVISDNAWNNEQGGKVALTDNNNLWHNYKLVVKGTALAVYRDGKLVIFKPDTKISMSDLGGYITYIGKSFYTGDTTWNGAIDDIKIYKGAELNLASAVTISADNLQNNSVSLIEGDSAQLTASVTPADSASTEVNWQSSNSSVATIDASGKLTAVKAGETTITASAKAGDATTQITVTVTPLDEGNSAQTDLDSAIAALKTQTTENLPLITKGTKHDSNIVWTSSDPSIITPTDTAYQAPANGSADPYQGGGIVTRPEYGEGDSKQVTVTATVTNGAATVTGKVNVVVKEKTRVAPDTGYAAVTFLSDSDTTDGKVGEALYESATSTKENNFFSFSQINKGNPVITSTTDTKGLRDPYVLRSHDGDKYYMIATDLKVSQQSWGQNQQYGSLKIEAWESNDMVNWVRTNAEDGTDAGIVVNSANQGMTWAPEAFWDDSLGAYVVFFSSRAYTDDSRTTPTTGANGYAYNIVRYSITRDFKTYSTPKDWQDTKYSRIDSSVFKIGEYYYRLTKNEEGGAAGSYVTTGKTTFLERSKCLTCATATSDPNADENSSWKLLDENILPFEGPESIALNPGDVNQNTAGDAMLIMADEWGYQPYMTSETAISATNWLNRLSQTEGWHTRKASGPNVSGAVFDKGMPTPKRHGAFVNVPQTVLEAMHAYTTENKATIQAVDSTTSVTYNKTTRKAVASVQAADKGSVAGTVTFKSGAWSQTVKLTQAAGKSAKSADATSIATVTIPDAVSSDVMVSYDGYADALVNPSNTVLTGVTAVDPTEPTHPVDPTNPVKPNEPGNANNTPSANNGNQQVHNDLASTGSAIGITVIAVLVLALAGAGIWLWRKHSMRQ